MRRFASVLFTSIFLSILSIEAFALGPENLTEIDPYLRGSNEFSCANYSHDEWMVSLENGKLKIGKFSHRDTVNLPIAGGSLVGHNRGEFGGGLEFIKGNETQKIFKENISSLFSLSDMRAAAFGGLAHMGFDNGYMLVIGRPSNTSNWKIEKQVKLSANPYAVAVKDTNNFFFVTGEGLYSVDWKTGESKKLKEASAGGLYPNSLVVANDGHLYVGMRYAVAHFFPEKDNYKVKWLVKKRCTGIKAIDGVPQ